MKGVVVFLKNEPFSNGARALCAWGLYLKSRLSPLPLPRPLRLPLQLR
jgi:hypothetical protein